MQFCLKRRCRSRISGFVLVPWTPNFQQQNGFESLWPDLFQDRSGWIEYKLVQNLATGANQVSSIVWDGKSNEYVGVESRIPGNDYGAGNHGNRRYVKYVPVGYADTHSKTVGYLFWLFGFTGAHRFYYGKPLTGVLWFFTFGLFGIGWLIDIFLIPEMDREADLRFAPGPTDYTIAWLLLIFAGAFGLHRFVQGRWVTGLAFLLTMGLFGLGVIYDVLTLNDQIDSRHREMQSVY